MPRREDHEVHKGHVAALGKKKKKVTNKFKSEGLHKKHVVATWNLGNHLSIRQQKKITHSNQRLTRFDVFLMTYLVLIQIRNED